MTDVTLRDFFQNQLDALKEQCRADRELLNSKITALSEKLDDSIENVARERVKDALADKEHFEKLNNEAERILKSQSLSISVDKFDGFAREVDHRLLQLEKADALTSGQTQGISKSALILYAVISTVIALALAVAAFLPKAVP